MERWLSEQDAADVLSVFVGASSSVKERALELSAAQKLRAEVNPALQLGGVAIPRERHSRTGSEHHRMVAKQQAGVSFFVTQVVSTYRRPSRCCRTTSMPAPTRGWRPFR